MKSRWSVVTALAMVLCGVAAAVRDNAPEGKVQQGAEKVCELCEAAGVLAPDGGVRNPLPPEVPAPPTVEQARGTERRTAVRRVGMELRPVLIPAGPGLVLPAALEAGGSATVEELPEEPPAPSTSVPKAVVPAGPGSSAQPRTPSKGRRPTGNARRADNDVSPADLMDMPRPGDEEHRRWTLEQERTTTPPLRAGNACNQVFRDTVGRQRRCARLDLTANHKHPGRHAGR